MQAKRKYLEKEYQYIWSMIHWSNETRTVSLMTIIKISWNIMTLHARKIILVFFFFRFLSHPHAFNQYLFLKAIKTQTLHNIVQLNPHLIPCSQVGYIITKKNEQSNMWLHCGKLRNAASSQKKFKICSQVDSKAVGTLITF